MYFGFSYLGELNFGHYGAGVTLMAGFLTLILAPEFFQPLRDRVPSTMPKLRPWAPQTA
nr:ATP-binding/permease protein CydD [Klebsiella pneumoniae]